MKLRKNTNQLYLHYDVYLKKRLLATYVSSCSNQKANYDWDLCTRNSFLSLIWICFIFFCLRTAFCVQNLTFSVLMLPRNSDLMAPSMLKHLKNIVSSHSYKNLKFSTENKINAFWRAWNDTIAVNQRLVTVESISWLMKYLWLIEVIRSDCERSRMFEKCILSARW